MRPLWLALMVSLVVAVASKITGLVILISLPPSVMVWLLSDVGN